MASYSPRKSTLFEFQRCQWHRWNRFRGETDTAETVSAVSMTPLKSFQRCLYKCAWLVKAAEPESPVVHWKILKFISHQIWGRTVLPQIWGHVVTIIVGIFCPGMFCPGDAFSWGRIITKINGDGSCGEGTHRQGTLLTMFKSNISLVTTKENTMK
jgi:hypothetical protein